MRYRIQVLGIASLVVAYGVATFAATPGTHVSVVTATDVPRIQAPFAVRDEIPGILLGGVGVRDQPPNGIPAGLVYPQPEPPPPPPTTTPTTAAHTAPPRASRTATTEAPAAPVYAASDEDAFARLRQCESGGNYQDNTGNGYYGAYQFSADTWHGLGYSGLPSEASPEVQDEAAHRLRDRSGWSQWPACSRKLGLR